jgi:hypothetical protein
MEQIENLVRQACFEGILEIECPVCGAIIIAEPDAVNLYCLECETITGQNPLIKFGLI